MLCEWVVSSQAWLRVKQEDVITLSFTWVLKLDNLEWNRKMLLLLALHSEWSFIFTTYTFTLSCYKPLLSFIHPKSILLLWVAISLLLLWVAILWVKLQLQSIRCYHVVNFEWNRKMLVLLSILLLLVAILCIIISTILLLTTITNFTTTTTTTTTVLLLYSQYIISLNSKYTYTLL